MNALHVNCGKYCVRVQLERRVALIGCAKRKVGCFVSGSLCVCLGFQFFTKVLLRRAIVSKALIAAVAIF